jgi:uncharacterized membrane protein
LTGQTVVDVPLHSRGRRRARSVAHATLWFLDHWVAVFLLVWGLYIVLPILAPVLMRLGWTGPGQLVYSIYSTMCHQMAQRSFFLFGPQPMYNLDQLPLQITGNQTIDMLTLRAFAGNPDIGWKVAWSDRMVYMYGTMWVAALLFGILQRRHRIRPLRLLTFGLLMLPMAIDGITHFLSDMSGGLGGGFRYSNQWLAELTSNTLPRWFYVGDALGSFNAWMRLFSGLAFGFAVIWLAFPYLNESLRESGSTLRRKLAQAKHHVTVA